MAVDSENIVPLIPTDRLHSSRWKPNLSRTSFGVNSHPFIRHHLKQDHTIQERLAILDAHSNADR